MPLAQVPIGDRFHSPFGMTLGLADLVSLILSNAIVLAGIILFILMIIGGIIFITGAGSGNKEDVAKGKHALTSAIVGFIIIICVYWIIKAIEVIFQFDILTPVI